VRLRGHDFAAAGTYYVTICAWRRGDVLGHIAGDTMVPNAIGQIITAR
jgi:hypothetical protein